MGANIRRLSPPGPQGAHGRLAPLLPARRGYEPFRQGRLEGPGLPGVAGHRPLLEGFEFARDVGRGLSRRRGSESFLRSPRRQEVTPREYLRADRLTAF